MSRSFIALAAFTATLMLGTAVEIAPAFSQHSGVIVGTRMNQGHRIRCTEGTRMLRNRGFSNIRALDCRGSHFFYRGDRGRRTYEIRVRARDGRVTEVTPVRWRR